MDVVRLLIALVGIGISLFAFLWAARILMVQGTPPPGLAKMVFRTVRGVMVGVARMSRSRDLQAQIWALYLPLCLIAIIAVALVFLTVGYTLIFYGTSQETLRTAYVNSLSSLSVLGIGGLPKTLRESTLALIESFTGPIIVALLITYLSSMNNAATERRRMLRQIEVEVGRAKNGADLVERAATGPGLDALTKIWSDWASEFAWFDQSYNTVEGYLLITAPNLSDVWSVRSLTVLDSAALRNAILQSPDPQATRVLTDGVETLQRIADHYDHHVMRLRRDRPLTDISRERFDQTYDLLTTLGQPIVADRESAWQQFRHWRATYVGAIEHLCHLMSPLAPSDLTEPLSGW